jgi:hypothetical protein
MKATLFILLLTGFTTQAQIINVKKALNSAVVNKTNSVINNGVNQGVNSVFSAPGKIFKKVKSNQDNSGNNQSNTPAPQPVQTGNDSYQGSIEKTVTSDFVAGTDILMSDNFSSTAIGSFPDSWLTNSSGEVRQVDGQAGRWLQFSANGIFALNQVSNLPDNFSLEFDAILHPTPSKDVHYILYLYSIKDKIPDFKETNYPGNAGIYFAFNTAAGEIDAENFEGGKAGIIDSHLVTDLLKSELANKMHISIARQKSKLSLYVNGSKVFSSPNALPANYTYNALKFGSFFMGADDFMLISNLTLAGF